MILSSLWPCTRCSKVCAATVMTLWTKYGFLTTVTQGSSDGFLCFGTEGSKTGTEKKSTLYHCVSQSLAFTSQQQENHEVGGGLELGDVLLPLSVHSLSHHVQQALHQAGLHQLQLYHIWRETEGEMLRGGYGEQVASYDMHRRITISTRGSLLSPANLCYHSI